MVHLHPAIAALAGRTVIVISLSRYHAVPSIEVFEVAERASPGIG
jgi:hypothetical protein